MPLNPKSCYDAQNGLGVVLAGGLGGFLYLQKQDKLKLEEQLSSELSSERSTVDDLKQKVSVPANWAMQLPNFTLFGRNVAVPPLCISY